MSYFGLNVAGSAIDAFQTAENITADNIANINTPGASRQVAHIIQQQPIVGSPFLLANPGNVQPGTRGDGVIVDKILRIHQDSYDALFRGATASQNYYNTEQSTLDGLQSALGEPSNGINTAYTGFQSAVQQLAGNPTDVPSQNNLLSTANNLVTVLNNSGQAILNQEGQTIAQATQVVNQINNLADRIATLNGQIRALTAVGNNPNTYLDQRDQLVDQLSGLLSTDTELQSGGSSLITVNGKALVNDTVAYHLAVPVVGSTANGQPVLVVGFVNDPNPANPVPVQVGGGQLGAHLDLYNNKLVPYKQKLDNFASTLVSETSRITETGYDSTGTAGGQLFQPIVAANPIGAGNIKVGIPSAAQIPIASASTQAGVLVKPLNSANNIVDTTASLLQNAANTSLANPIVPGPPPPTGTLTVTTDGVAQNYVYSTVQGYTTLTASAAAGAGVINVASTANIVAGDNIVVGAGADAELVNVTGVGPGNTLTITALANAHAAGEGAGGNAGTIDNFINSFNGSHYGVTASFDVTAQRMVFTRDPSNIDLIHRAAMQAAGTLPSPTFKIQDSNIAVNGSPEPALGATTNALLAALGASPISGIQQDSTNAFGATNANNANNLLAFFTTAYGVPAIQTTSPTAIAAPGLATVTVPAGTITQFHVGDILTIDATTSGAAPQENVTVSSVNYNTNQITFTCVNPHLANFTITSAQTQTLQAFYASTVAGMGVDQQTATTGNTSQTTLSANIDQVRQGVDGINIDEETQNLIKYQNAYAAAAHVISVISSMLSDAVNLGTGSTF
jgi:flagellar hook-associated protein 1 FlgK